MLPERGFARAEFGAAGHEGELGELGAVLRRRRRRRRRGRRESRVQALRRHRPQLPRACASNDTVRFCQIRERERERVSRRSPTIFGHIRNCVEGRPETAQAFGRSRSSPHAQTPVSLLKCLEIRSEIPNRLTRPSAKIDKSRWRLESG